MITREQLHVLRDSCCPYDTTERHLMQQCTLALLVHPDAADRCEAEWRRRSAIDQEGR